MPTLEELDGRWPEPPADATPLEKRCAVLRRLPLEEIDVPGLRLLLGQRVSVRRVLPLAVDVLVADPMAPVAPLAPGELLAVALRLAPAAWPDDERARLVTVLQGLAPGALPPLVQPDVEEFLAVRAPASSEPAAEPSSSADPTARRPLLRRWPAGPARSQRRGPR